ncbi:lytic transglycosylase domain-containing protein [Nitrobacter sp. JJSN]|uniref:lytic transglycosylase domain-containing protein n=1 Tax=Nitrobacter sp. JJSN TaxID=3453033 RepID=UPI003F75A9A6
MSRISRRFASHLRRWQRRGTRVCQNIAKTPRPVRIAGAVAVVLATGMTANLMYQIVRKPAELFFFVGHRLDKEPAETWRQYGQLFRTYATRSISPELLAALAQVESSGNPVDRTYWRWQFSFNPFKTYQPASSAVGLFQMTDPAYSEVARFCIRARSVEDTGCGFGPYIRVIPSHAVELASIYLDRNVAAVLTRAGNVPANERQRQDLAAFIHLCGGGPATAYARRHFQMNATERCGDHLVAAYIFKVDTMRRRFQRLAANDV